MAVDPNCPVRHRRAQLVVQCACELLGISENTRSADLMLPINVAQFQEELKSRYGERYPELVNRNEASIERARLDRDEWPELPRVILRQGAPSKRARQMLHQAVGTSA